MSPARFLILRGMPDWPEHGPVWEQVADITVHDGWTYPKKLLEGWLEGAQGDVAGTYFVVEMRQSLTEIYTVSPHTEFVIEGVDLDEAEEAEYTRDPILSALREEQSS